MHIQRDVTEVGELKPVASIQVSVVCSIVYCSTIQPSNAEKCSQRRTLPHPYLAILVQRMVGQKQKGCK